MATTHPITLRGKHFTEVIITDHNVHPKLKAQPYFFDKERGIVS